MEVKQKVKENTVYDDRKERASTDDFGRAISRIAAAQICENIGFEGFNESALDSFADITVKYLYDLGKTATFCAILAGRTEVNVFDVIEGLGDLGGSTGASKWKPISCSVFRSWRKDMAAVSLAAKLPNETDKNHVSLLEIFSPAIEALKDDPSESGNGVEENPSDQGSAVCLECRPGKKVLRDSFDLRLRNKGSRRTASGFRWDKKKMTRREEQSCYLDNLLKTSRS
ncbi:transcription initiation factor tfiid subunit 8 [Nicotiana attenuata]|uniref:Transcription initiation factor tfiid subunit 8 n=1 Tax=Nicotiana attenuata TaxID=49451 RepID=A0A1J6IJP0_NICAT|nr:transcription initiation factor tfiid subunit 8 [Nicotiana attenuata]